MKKEGFYSSGEFARMAHVTVRTIRYYDSHDILKPSFVNESGARFYTDEDFTRLQQILLLKFLGFSLNDIKNMTIGDMDYHFLSDSLEVQLKLVRDKIEQLQLVEKAIEDTPLTMVTSKQLLPIYDKPMIYYPMSVLMNAGIRDILIISTPADTPRFQDLLGDGHQFGVNLQYAVQPSPDGLAQAFIIGADFIGDEPVAMVLGDNIFAGHGLKKRLKAAVENAETGKGATVFGYYVDDPERFGIVEFDKNGKAVSIEEKPEHPKSNYCVTGLYFYDNRVVEYAKNLKPSARGELEITDLNRIYLEDNSLNVELLGQGFTWLDTGTHESLVDATNFVKTVEQHQHRKIACLEEIAYLNGWISKEEVLEVYEVLKKNQYGQYLKAVLDGKYQEHLY